MRHYFELHARYNQSMNACMMEVLGNLSAAQRSEDRGAFFGSIEGTFNHILVADTIWMKRFSGHPARFPALASLENISDPESLSAPLFTCFDDLVVARNDMDRRIIEFISQTSDNDYSVSLSYHNSRGASPRKRLGDLLLHFFNHQTHHRGQITTLLSQAGVDIGVTDLLALIPNSN